MWIAQISDPHVRPAGVRYKDTMDTNAALAAAVRQINALEPLPDLVILSGDVVDEGDAAEYDNARAILGDLRAPLMLIPGNHDDRARFRSAFASNLADSDAVSPSGPLHQVRDTAGPVRIVALDVTVPGRHHGQMTDEAADWLERTLAAEPDRPTVLVMHQPPIDSGIPYLDKVQMPRWASAGGGRRAFPERPSRSVRPCPQDHHGAVWRDDPVYCAQHRNSDRASHAGGRHSGVGAGAAGVPAASLARRRGHADAFGADRRLPGSVSVRVGNHLQIRTDICRTFSEHS